MIEVRRREHAWVRGRYEDILLIASLRSGYDSPDTSLDPADARARRRPRISMISTAAAASGRMIPTHDPSISRTSIRHFPSAYGSD